MRSLSVLSEYSVYTEVTLTQGISTHLTPVLDTCWQDSVCVYCHCYLFWNTEYLFSLESWRSPLNLPTHLLTIPYEASDSTPTLWLHQLISSSRAVLSHPVTSHSCSQQRFYRQLHLITFHAYWHSLFDILHAFLSVIKIKSELLIGLRELFVVWLLP